MTIKEAILSGVPVDLPDATIEKILIDRSLPGDGTYSATLTSTIALATADALVEASRQPSFTEGDLSVTIPKARMISDAKRLYRNNGEPKKASALSGGYAEDKSNSW